MKKIFIVMLSLMLGFCVLGFTACGVKFKLNFIVDGEIYSSIDTTGQEVVQMPANPTKEGYSFDGWFWDKDTWERPFTASSLLQEPLSSDMNVYCKWKSNTEVVNDEITFNTLTVDGENVYGKVSNATTTYSFLNEIVEHGNATYQMYREISCETVIASKSIALDEGDNTVYVLQTVGKELKLYVVTIHRRFMFNVTFNTNCDTLIESQSVEEDSLISKPSQISKEGYTFDCWDYDFNNPIVKDTVITARWTANTNTPYKVEYYLENLNSDDYSLQTSENKLGTTDTIANATIKSFEHFTYKQGSTESGNINGDGSTILKVYYTRNAYTLSINDSTVGNITYAGSYEYGSSYITSHATIKLLGYDFIGWCSGDDILSTDFYYEFKADKDVVARFELKQELAKLQFTSTTTECIITGVKDKTLEEIEVPDCVTSISCGAFGECYRLKSLTIPFVGEAKTNTNNTNFGYIFSANSLTETNIGIPSSLKTVIITGGEVIANHAFLACKSIESVTIPDSVKSIGDGAFVSCESLKTVTFGENIRITIMGEHLFYGCKQLQSIEIPASVTSVHSKAFDECESLKNIVVNPDNATYISIDGNLYNKDVTILVCYAKGKQETSFDIPDTVTTIGSYAFSGSNLTNIEIPDTVINIEKSAFAFCNSLESITVPFIGESKDSSNNGHFGYIFGANSYHFNDIYVPSSLKNVVIIGGTRVGNNAFERLSSIESITLPDSVVFIGEEAFLNCTSLKTTPFSENSQIASILSRTFDDCESLTNVIIPDGVRTIGEYAFGSCSSLTDLTIPTSLTSVNSLAFNGSSVHNLYYKGTMNEWVAKELFPTWKNYKLYIDNQLVTDVYVEEGIISDYAFRGCISLESITIGENVTSVGRAVVDNRGPIIYCESKIQPTGWHVQWNNDCPITWDCKNNDVANDGYIYTIVNGLRYGIVSGKAAVMEQKRDITTAKIESSITYKGISYDVTVIKYNAFDQCGQLTTVEIPKTVTRIGSGAFYDCSSLVTIKYNGTVAEWHSISKESNGITKAPAKNNIACLDGNTGYYPGY